MASVDENSQGQSRVPRTPHCGPRTRARALKTGNCSALAGSALLASVLLPGIALGADAADSGANASAASAAASNAASQQLDAVVVTAQKRKENLNEVPISISVLSGDQLQKRRIENYEDLTRAVPDLSFTAGGNSGLTNIEIRGVSSSSGSATVGTYLDDVSMTVPNTLDVGATEPRFFDIDQVEVLRGPQGTLYGASSLGGTIKFNSRQPDSRQREVELLNDLSYTEHGGFNHLHQGVLNLPLSPGVSALRLGIQYDESSGYVDQLSPALASDGVTPLAQHVTDHDINGERALVLKAAYQYAAHDWSISPALFFQRVQTDNSDLFDLGSFLETSKLVQESGSDAFFVPSVTLKYDLGWADLTSVSSYFWRHYRSIRDGTSYNSGYLAELLSGDAVLSANFPDADPAPVGVRPGPAYFTPTIAQGAEELRIASKSMKESGKSYDWIAGLYLADQHSHLSDNEYIDDGIATLGSIYGTDGADILQQNLQNPVDSGGAGLSAQQAALAVSSGNEVYFNESSQDQRQVSLFGEFNLAPIEHLTLTFGARYLLSRTGVKNAAGGYYNADAPAQQDSVAHAYAFTPKFSARYAIDGNHSIYASAVKGFRLGGANLQVPYYGCAADEAELGVNSPPLTYGPDSLWSYELGSKSDLLHKRLSVDASIYYIDWQKVQQQIFLPNCGFDYTENAGDARSYGLDLSVRGKLTRHLTLGLTGSATRAEITRAVPGAGAVDGSRLLGVPSWTLTPSLSYSGSIGNGLQGDLNIDWSWIGPSHGAFDHEDLDFDRTKYSILNASFAVSLPQGLQIAMYAKNLLNEDAIIQHIERLDVNQGYIVRPRTLGVTLTASF